jgi:hypothetical protein
MEAPVRGYRRKISMQATLSKLMDIFYVNRLCKIKLSKNFIL